jgi:cystathionine beta-lyase
MNSTMSKYNFDKIVNRRGTNCLKYDKLEEIFGNSDALPLWVADTDFEVPDFIIEAFNKRLEHKILGYTYKPESYYDAIIEWMRRKHGWDIKKGWIKSAPGVVPSLTLLIMALSEPGDKVVVQTPVYFPFFSCVNDSGRVLVENPLVLRDNRYYFDFEDLKSKLDEKTKLLILCSPHNPGGMVWRREELEELGRICIENGTIIISDEIHSDLVFKGHKHIPLPEISEEVKNNCIVCMAPNKTFNVAGLASSIVIIPNRRLRIKYERLINVIHLQGGHIFGNIAIEEAYAKGWDWLEELLTYLEENLNYVVSFFSEKMPKVKVMIPESTFLVWLDFRDYGISEKKLFRILVDEAGVALNIGSMFGTGGEGFFRINIGCPKATLKEALNRINRVLD